MIIVMAPSLRRGTHLPTILLLFFYFFLFLPLSLSVNAAELFRPVPEHNICKTLDIRNKLEAFKQLNDCHVIEGSLQILLFDTVNETEFATISFPNLTEITDYLLLFRVNGLKSLGQLFPNLAVIRGENLFAGSKSLIIFEMASLQEINLYSLTSILDGRVHIDKNPSLCFVKSVDWSKITGNDDNVFVKSFKPENECPVCPQSVNGKACPRNEKEGKYLCWNRDHCQKICRSDCETCNNEGECCSPRCLGGCERDTLKCISCKEFVLNTAKDDASKCVQNCPSRYLVYLDRRCVTQDECVNMVRPLDYEDVDSVTNIVQTNPYKIHNGKCLLRCPSEYVGNYTNHSCTKCNNTCRKECPGARIDSINLAEKLFGCTHITGSIEIQIRGGDQVVKSLAHNLGMIEEIDGYLKVVRSFSLVSLNFLKNLKRIRGNILESQRYSLIVLDNQNLQDLFDWSSHKEFQIDKGRLFFHFNPKLCLDKIEALRKKADLPEPDIMEVASNSNGDKVACSISKLEVNITKRSSRYVKLEWAPFEMDDPRKLLSYVIYYKETKDKNVNFYDGRDACGQDNWHVDDVVNNVNIEVFSHTLTNLEPYTLYAFYVKTYTIANERRGAQSDIQYFTTKAAQPSEPAGVNVASLTPNSLSISWFDPSKPNGQMSHYVVYGIKHHYDPLPKDRNYCRDGVTADISKPLSTIPPKTTTQKCKETKNKEEPKVNEMDEQARIDFENALHNKVYVRTKYVSRIEPNRSRRSIDKVIVDKDTVNSTFLFGVKIPEYLTRNNTTLPVNTTEPGTHYQESFAFRTYGMQRDVQVYNLRHYTAYDIFVWACRGAEQDDSEEVCGQPAHRPAQTIAKPHADDIKNITVLNTTSNSVTIMWQQPPDPNRMIVSVNIYYKREDSKNNQVSRGCISHRDFKNYTSDGRYLMHTISELYPGNYSLYLTACSLRGPGSPSPSIVFYIVESSQNTTLIVCLILLLITMISLIAAWLYYKKIKKGRTERLIPSINPDYLTTYVPDEWEVPRKNVSFVKELGQGSFGMVYEGIGVDLKEMPGKNRCAVKTVNENATARERVEFLNEASVMKAFNTTHVVKLLGVVSQGQPALVIMELMAHGDLKTYLRLHRPENGDGRSPPTLKQVLQMALEIADGMAYLEGKKFVHRDLAARNCMVAEDLTVKIGDFGMTRDIYETDYYRKGSRGLLPVRWMSPESLKDGVFSSSSDAFSYGIVLWEMATLASQPYQGLSNEQVLRYVMDGGLMERPENCPDKLYDIMSACWDPKPGKRPTFMELCEKLLPDATEHFLETSFYNSKEGAEVRAIRAAAAEGTGTGDGDDADASTPLNPLPPDLRIVGAYATSSQSENSDSGQSVHVDPNPRFYSISEDRTANGYTIMQARNGKAQSQC